MRQARPKWWIEAMNSETWTKGDIVTYRVLWMKTPHHKHTRTFFSCAVVFHAVESRLSPRLWTSATVRPVLTIFLTMNLIGHLATYRRVKCTVEMLGTMKSSFNAAMAKWSRNLSTFRVCELARPLPFVTKCTRLTGHLNRILRWRHWSHADLLWERYGRLWDVGEIIF